jgi:hypothetical protein
MSDADGGLTVRACPYDLAGIPGLLKLDDWSPSSTRSIANLDAAFVSELRPVVVGGSDMSLSIGIVVVGRIAGCTATAATLN